MARRFGGRDKGALVVGNRTILERQIEELSHVTDDIMIVGRPQSGPPGAALRCVRDRVEGRGPLAGLDAALDAARDDELIVLACDLPYVTSDLLGHLVALATDDVDAVVPTTGRGYHPLCAVYRRTCHPVVSRHLAEGRLAIHAVLDRVRVRAVTRKELQSFGDGDRLLANVNTLAEYDQLETLQGHQR
jgi:molybdopterin-guanine dinucleotide biosynthesis protein A